MTRKTMLFPVLFFALLIDSQVLGKERSQETTIFQGALKFSHVEGDKNLKAPEVESFQILSGGSSSKQNAIALFNKNKNLCSLQIQEFSENKQNKLMSMVARATLKGLGASCQISNLSEIYVIVRPARRWGPGYLRFTVIDPSQKDKNAIFIYRIVPGILEK